VVALNVIGGWEGGTTGRHVASRRPNHVPKFEGPISETGSGSLRSRRCEEFTLDSIYSLIRLIIPFDSIKRTMGKHKRPSADHPETSPLTMKSEKSNNSAFLPSPPSHFIKSRTKRGHWRERKPSLRVREHMALLPGSKGNHGHGRLEK